MLFYAFSCTQTYVYDCKNGVAQQMYFMQSCNYMAIVDAYISMQKKMKKQLLLLFWGGALILSMTVHITYKCIYDAQL